MNIEPRKRFQENSKWVDFHQNLVVSEHFRAAIEATLAQMMVDSRPHDLAENASAAYYRMEGAREFARVLLNLAERPKLPPVNRTPNLDHKV